MRSTPSQDQEGLLRIEEDHSEELLLALDELARVEILVGIPSDSDPEHFDEGGRVAAQGEERRPTEEGGIQSNATLGYIHEHGSPVNNVPARPWLGPGVEESKGTWLRYMQQAGEAALTFPHDSLKMERGLHAAGMAAVSSVKVRIVSGLEPPLKPATIRARQRRTPSRQAATSADVTPLVDTAQLLNSISYVIKK